MRRKPLAILGVGIALAALILTSTAGMRSEFQAEFRAVRAEARADREALPGRGARRSGTRCAPTTRRSSTTSSG